MAEEFLSDLPIFTDSPQRLLTDPRDDRERLRLILIGSATGVREMIHKLHVCRVADAGNWSRLLPVPNSDEVMSILVIDRPRSRNPIG